MSSDYKKLVEDHCIFSYKWNPNIIKHILKPYQEIKQFYKILNSNSIDIIELNVIYPFFKIITLSRLILSENINLYSLSPQNIIKTIKYNRNYKNSDIQYIYKIKICENNDIITIMDESYNNYKILDKIYDNYNESESEKSSITIQELISSILELLN